MCKECHSCIRILMMIFNFIFVLCGLGLFGLGLYFYLSSFFKNMGPDGSAVVIAFYVTMGVGAFTLIVGACGCCGAYHESPCLLGTYFIFLLLIFAAEIAAGVLVFLYKDTVKAYVESKFEKGKNAISGDPTKNSGHWMHEAHKYLQCCGNKGPSDYLPSPPKSCCLNDNCDNVNAMKGCGETWKDLIQSKWILFASILLGIALIELLGLIFSMCLCCTARSIDYDMVETRA